MPSAAFRLSKWSLQVASRLIKADVRVYRAEPLEDDMTVIFVVNHFTRLETLLLPYMLHKETGRHVWSLAANELFVGRIGRYLNSAGAISTTDPDRDKTIVHSLLSGEKWWIIFPEGAMIKDKKVVDTRGLFTVYNKGARRPPHTGAAMLALRTEYYRQKLRCLRDRGDEEEIAGIQEHFQLDSVDDALDQRTVIVPVNITYFPIRSQENVVLRAARAFAKDLSPRAVEELSVEGTVLSKDTDIDITLGAPIDVRSYLEGPEYQEMMACNIDDYGTLKQMENDPASAFTEAARRLMYRYMSDIYRLTTVNYDHLSATIIRHLPEQKFTEENYRSRVFLAAHHMMKLGHHRVHNVLRDTYREVVFDEPSPKLLKFLDLCVQEGVVLKEEDGYVRNFGLSRDEADFHQIRMDRLTQVISNEIEPLGVLTNLIKDVARKPDDEVIEEIRQIFLEEDQALFEADYQEHYNTEESKPPSVGRPYFLFPDGPIQGGVVLTHGYLAAPEEVREFATFLRDKGYIVYAPRMRGHGTTPDDLVIREWEEWYEGLNRGYAVIRSYTDNIILGGFSIGGVMTLLAAGRKGPHVKAAFSICAPLALQNFGARFVPTVVSINALIKRVRKSHERWEFVPNYPENPNINYTRNPLAGVSEVARAMDALKDALPNIVCPTYIVQASRDHVVKPVSGQMIFDRVGTPNKELCVLERDRHGIINGDGREDVFDRVYHFLQWAKDRPAASMETIPAESPQEAVSPGGAPPDEPAANTA